MSRSYGQYCGLARALDVVGDRWNLLIVRELLIRPMRYRELHADLSGAATNLLIDRLRDLEHAGVVERRLADESNAVVYGLTPWGAQLREPIEGLIRWSAPLMMRGPAGDRFAPQWLLVALPALFAGKPPIQRQSTIGIAVDGAMIQIRTAQTGIDVMLHDGDHLEAVVHAEAAITLGLAAGMLTLDTVAELVEIEGDKTAARAIFDRLADDHADR